MAIGHYYAQEHFLVSCFPISFFLCYLQSLKVQNLANDGKATAAVKAVLSKPFRPGQFFLDISKAGVTFGIPRDDVITKIVSAAEQHFAGTL